MINNKLILRISTYLFFVFTYIEDTLPYGQVLTFVSLALMLFTVIYGHSLKLILPKSCFFTYMLSMLLYCWLSMLWAESPSLTTIAVRGILMSSIKVYIVYVCCYHQLSTNDFLKIMMYGGYTVVIYSIMRYGWNMIMDVLAEDVRLANSALMNTNTLGMCAAYSIVINFYYVVNEKIRISDLLSLPTAIIIAASGSRKAILIVVAGVLLITILKNFNGKNIVANSIKCLLGCAFVVIVLFVLLQLPIFSNIMSRLSLLSTRQKNYNGIIASDIRQVYNIIGWNLFREHPFVGIGIHNASLYISMYYGHPHLHNNFIELLACGGIVGFLIHYSFYIYLFMQFWHMRKFRDEVFDICITLLLVRFVMGYGYIQYYSTMTYFNLMVFYMFITDRIEKYKGQEIVIDNANI